MKEVYIPEQYFKLGPEANPEELYLYDYALLYFEGFDLERYFGSFGFDFSWEDKLKKSAKEIA